MLDSLRLECQWPCLGTTILSMLGFFLHVSSRDRGEDFLASHSKVISCPCFSVPRRDKDYVPFVNGHIVSASFRL